MEIERTTLQKLLSSWEADELDEKNVHDQAELWWDTGGNWPELPESDPRSIPVEVLAQLDTLNVQLIIKEDIPAIRRFLSAAPGLEEAAWREWKAYWEAVDFEARKRQLANHGYYCV